MPRAEQAGMAGPVEPVARVDPAETVETAKVVRVIRTGAEAATAETGAAVVTAALVETAEMSPSNTKRVSLPRRTSLILAAGREARVEPEAGPDFRGMVDSVAAQGTAQPKDIPVHRALPGPTVPMARSAL